MDRFELMATFVAVVEAGGFSAASRKLHVPLATVSRKVAELEESLKVRLLVRSTRSVSLTDTGREYFERCRRVLEDLAEAERLASGEYRAPKGLIAVSAPVVFGRAYVAPVVVEFLKAYPDVDVDLRLGASGENMIEQQLDAAIRIGPLRDSSLVAIRAGEIRHVVCASPDYIERNGAPRHPNELIRHDCVTLAPNETSTEWVFFRDKGAERYPVRSRLTVTTAEAAADAAAAGVGVAHLFCYQVSRAIGEGRLSLLMREFEPPPFPVHIVHASGRQMPQKLRAFIDFVLPRLKSKLVLDA